MGEHEEVWGGVGGVGPEEEAVGVGGGSAGGSEVRDPLDGEGGPLEGVGEDEVVEVRGVLLPYTILLRCHGDGVGAIHGMGYFFSLFLFSL